MIFELIIKAFNEYSFVCLLHWTNVIGDGFETHDKFVRKVIKNIRISKYKSTYALKYQNKIPK